MSDREVNYNITEKEIEACIEDVKYFASGMATVAIVTMQNGFQVIGHAICVNPAIYEKAAGEKYAKKHAMRQIKNSLTYQLFEQRYEQAANVPLDEQAAPRASRSPSKPLMFR
jgi:hypothetical protein